MSRQCPDCECWRPDSQRVCDCKKSIEEKPGLTLVDRLVAPEPQGTIVSNIRPKPAEAGVVQLHKSKPATDIPETLRRIADEIERGEKMEVVTTAIVILGHTYDKPTKDNPEVSSFHAEHELFGIGPRVDLFTIRGLLSHALIRMGM